MPKQISFKSIIFVNRIVQRLENSTDNLFRDTKVFNGGLHLRVVARHGRLQRTPTLKPYLLGVFSHIRSGFILLKSHFYCQKFSNSIKKRYFCKQFPRMWRNGSRARLRIWCREAWGFESLQPHKKNSLWNYS